MCYFFITLISDCWKFGAFKTEKGEFFYYHLKLFLFENTEKEYGVCLAKGVIKNIIGTSIPDISELVLEMTPLTDPYVIAVLYCR